MTEKENYPRLRAEDFCPKCPLFKDCPRPFGFKEPRHNNPIPAEKVKVSIV